MGTGPFGEWAEFDVPVRLAVRVGVPVLTVVAVVFAVMDRSAGWTAWSAVGAWFSFSAQRTALVVVEPTVLQRNTRGTWHSVRLDRLRLVSTYRSRWGRTLHLRDDEGGRILLGTRIWWDWWGWRRLYGVVGDWVRLRADDPQLELNGHGVARILSEHSALRHRSTPT